MGKRVVITGASRGLGRVLSIAFARAGARVALMARTREDLEHLAGEIDGETLLCTGDVRDVSANEGVADRVVAEWGGLDVWISNAGISPIVASPTQIGRASCRERVYVLV